MTIAQRFNAGTGQFCVALVPKGRLNPSSPKWALFTSAVRRPLGTWGGLTAKPSVETLGYSRMSLRDNNGRPGQGNFRKALHLNRMSQPVQSQKQKPSSPDTYMAPGATREPLSPKH